MPNTENLKSNTEKLSQITQTIEQCKIVRAVFAENTPLILEMVNSVGDRITLTVTPDWLPAKAGDLQRVVPVLHFNWKKD